MNINFIELLTISQLIPSWNILLATISN